MSSIYKHLFIPKIQNILLERISMNQKVLDQHNKSLEQQDNLKGLQHIRVGLLGLGTVGTGVYRMIEDYQDDLQQKTGCSISIHKILVQNRDKARSLVLEQDKLTTDPDEVLHDPDIDMVIEVMGGVSETRDHLIQALKNHKHVVTANKDLIASHGGELLKLASEQDCDLFYEASVAGGIPILRGLDEGFSSDRITKMLGILNGTTNYMLSKMTKEGVSYDACLGEAQELGYAEADPTSDVEGLDAARKIAILGTLAYHTDISLDEVDVKGISSIDQKDVKYGQEFGYEMKLLGIADRNDDGIELSVQPTFIPQSHPLSNVDGVYNAVYVHGQSVGETMFYGPGAGELPTATAVTSDLVSVVKNIKLGVNGKGNVAPYNVKKMKPKDKRAGRYFVRFIVQDEPGVMATIAETLSNYDMSISQMVQHPLENHHAEIVMITHDTTLAALESWKAHIQSYQLDIASLYAIEGGEL